MSLRVVDVDNCPRRILAIPSPSHAALGLKSARVMDIYIWETLACLRSVADFCPS